MSERLKIGVSRCLLGERVRYDGKLKRSGLIADRVAGLFDFEPVCPEVEAGYPVPRPPVQLVGDPNTPQVLGVSDRSLDLTAGLKRYSRQRVATLGGVCGFLLKARSPSCGLDIPLHDLAGEVRGRSQGVFVCALGRRFPLLPVEDEEGMAEPQRGGDFLLRVLLFACWQGKINGGGVEDSLFTQWRQWLQCLYPGSTSSPQDGAVLKGRLVSPEDAVQRLRHLPGRSQ